MKSFDDAARAAAVELEPRIDKLLASLCNTLKEAGFLPQNVCVDTYNEDAEDTVRFFNEVIAKHFAPLAELQALLIQLTKLRSEMHEAILRKDFGPKTKVLANKCDAILNHPTVAAAIKDESEEK